MHSELEAVGHAQYPRGSGGAGRWELGWQPEWGPGEGPTPGRWRTVGYCGGTRPGNSVMSSPSLGLQGHGWGACQRQRWWKVWTSLSSQWQTA